MTNLNYKTFGQGDPIIFIHGFTLDHRMWQPQIDYFSKNYKVIVYDVRGFGESPMPKNGDSHVKDLSNLIKSLKIESAHIVGLSMGGRIAINFSLQYPELVKSLALIDSAIDNFPSDIDWRVYAKELGMEQAKQNWLNHEIFAGIKSQKVLRDIKSIVADYSGWHWLNSTREPEIDAPARLSEIKVPTLILVGERDIKYYKKVAQFLYTHIKNSKKFVIKNAGHMSSMEASDEVNQLINEFISDL